MKTLFAWCVLLMSFGTVALAAADDNANPRNERQGASSAQQQIRERLGWSSGGSRPEPVNVRRDTRRYYLSEQLSRQASRAEAVGDYAFAHRLQVKSERLRQHLDCKDVRIDARNDRRTEYFAFGSATSAWCQRNNRQLADGRYKRPGFWRHDRVRLGVNNSDLFGNSH